QCPTATCVAGYNVWKKEFERQVKRGEHGILIFAPSQRKRAAMVEKKDPSTGQTLYGPDGKPLMEPGFAVATHFVPVYVFDVGQTEGKELPNIAVSELSGEVENFEDISAHLSALSPLPIMFGPVPGTAKGYASHMEGRIVIKPGMSQVQTLKTMIHEIAHGILHAPDFLADQPKQRREKEVEAESVTYVVCQHFGIDTSDYSFGYVAGWSRGRELDELKASLDVIHSTAGNIIDAIQPPLQRSQEQELSQVPQKGRQRKPKKAKRK
ncbi:MAG: ImmA/IrrE family metallo-endopeptidase, partial [Oscillospiraceae bacterium]|nr:ImmA/IrrE family metallo-endopeptidase [Oscillospiraceae bacterium]